MICMSFEKEQGKLDERLAVNHIRLNQLFTIVIEDRLFYNYNRSKRDRACQE